VGLIREIKANKDNRRIDIGEAKALFRPLPASRKGDNGKLLVIGGSKLFHGASLWAVKIASRVVDLVFYHSIPENLKPAQKILLLDFIAIPSSQLDNYIQEADAILTGPGLTREPATKTLTNRLLKKYSKKRWVIDAGSLQTMEKRLLGKNQIITPHLGEFQRLFKPPGKEMELLKTANQKKRKDRAKIVQKYSQKHSCIILLKGPIDIITSPVQWKYNTTGNAGMTKGGTGDVLAGLIAALACKNDLFLSACAGAYINGLAGDRLKKKVGVYFNASDLCNEIPQTIHSLVKK
jgi:NAD(P)H-hydrate epimerase